MALFQRFIHAVRGRLKRKQNTNFTLDVDTLRSLEFLAEQEQRTPEEIANQILGDALRNHQAQGENWQRWQTLTPREQEIAALICLDYTSREIAEKLHISPETVKTHAEHILVKFGLADRTAMRLMLNGWDFSAWDR
jgi:DNA-binding CsgD family transcriptional regulator